MDICQNRLFVFKFTIFFCFVFLRSFQPSFWLEVKNIVSWTISNPISRNTYHYLYDNFQENRIKTFSVTVPQLLFFINYCGRDVINNVNELKHNSAQIDLQGIVLTKFLWNLSGSFGSRLYTEKHTDRQTDRQTYTQTHRLPSIFGRKRSQYVQSLIMTECKKLSLIPGLYLLIGL